MESWCNSGPLNNCESDRKSVKVTRVLHRLGKYFNETKSKAKLQWLHQGPQERVIAGIKTTGSKQMHISAGSSKYWATLLLQKRIHSGLLSKSESIISLWKWHKCGWVFFFFHFFFFFLSNQCVSAVVIFSSTANSVCMSMCVPYLHGT